MWQLRRDRLQGERRRSQVVWSSSWTLKTVQGQGGGPRTWRSRDRLRPESASLGCEMGRGRGSLVAVRHQQGWEKHRMHHVRPFSSTCHPRKRWGLLQSRPGCRRGVLDVLASLDRAEKNGADCHRRRRTPPSKRRGLTPSGSPCGQWEGCIRGMSVFRGI
jgi:hypothetical protein